MPDTLIIGGGISGLSAAYYLAKAGAGATIVDPRPRLGGGKWGRRFRLRSGIPAASWRRRRHVGIRVIGGHRPGFARLMPQECGIAGETACPTRCKVGRYA